VTDLVAGGSGLVGSALLDLLLAQEPPVEVIALVRRPLGRAHPRLRTLVADFAQLGAAMRGGAQSSSLPSGAPLTGVLPSGDLQPVQRVFIALGATIRAASSPAAFRAVDHDHVVAVARAAHAAGARRLAVVSAVGADPESRVFYNRVKGEMERSVAALGFDTVLIARPSLLGGSRAQTRPAERVASMAAQWLEPLIAPRYRVIPATSVARAMVGMVDRVGTGVTTVESETLRTYGE
jgi:uncharacterized protein YbjT (DUF2867 family)